MRAPKVPLNPFRLLLTMLLRGQHRSRILAAAARERRGPPPNRPNQILMMSQSLNLRMPASRLACPTVLVVSMDSRRLLTIHHP